MRDRRAAQAMTDAEVEQSLQQDRRVLASDVDKFLRCARAENKGSSSPFEIGHTGIYGETWADGTRRPANFFTMRVLSTTKPVGVLSLRLKVVASSWHGTAVAAESGASGSRPRAPQGAGRGRSRSPCRGSASQRQVDDDRFQ